LERIDLVRLDFAIRVPLLERGEFGTLARRSGSSCAQICL
jgi:hypothetical protein